MRAASWDCHRSVLRNDTHAGRTLDPTARSGPIRWGKKYIYLIPLPLCRKKLWLLRFQPLLQGARRSLASVITLFENVKEIVRGIGYAQFLPNMCCIAGRGRFPSFGIGALNGFNPREQAVAPPARDREQQPRNGIRVR